MEDFDLTINDIAFPMIFVRGTKKGFCDFGTNEQSQQINIRDFYISKFLVTQGLWVAIMGENPAKRKEANLPAVEISYLDICSKEGFLAKLNALDPQRCYRLPSETEWEYAARGGTYWTDGFTHSGSNNLDEVGWFHGNSGIYSDPVVLSQMRNGEKGTKTQPVGLKKPNQLGIHDMSGNVWEWCEDYFIRDTSRIPKDGLPCRIESPDRVLRGGCHHNGPVHCTVSNRYEISPGFKDDCIGFRLALSSSPPASKVGQL